MKQMVVWWEASMCCCFLPSSALQSPIEYQRRESKSNSLGRSMRPPLSAASALRPHSSASIDRHKLPSLHSHNTSLPALYLPSHGQGQGQGASETSSQQDVSGLLFIREATEQKESISALAVLSKWTPTMELNKTSTQKRRGGGFNPRSLCDITGKLQSLNFNNI